MTTPRRPNPYRDLGRQDLYRACQRRARELLERGVQRTPEQRVMLTQDTADLLVALSWWIHRSEHVPHSPQRELAASDQVSFAEVWWADFRRLSHDCIFGSRLQTLQEAAELALGSSPRPWLDPGGEGYSIYRLGTSGDEGLREALTKLEVIYRRRRGGK